MSQSRNASHSNSPMPPRLTPELVRKVMRLQRDLHRAPNPSASRERLLEGVCELIKADRAIAMVSRMDEHTGARIVLSVTHFGPSGPAIPSTPDGARPMEASVITTRTDPGPLPRVQDVLDVAGFVRCIDSFVWLDGPHRVGWIAVGRPQGGRKFTPRDRALVQLVHEESAWLYREFLPRSTTRGSAIAAPAPPTLQVFLPLRSGKIGAGIRKRAIPQPHSA